MKVTPNGHVIDSNLPELSEDGRTGGSGPFGFLQALLRQRADAGARGQPRRASPGGGGNLRMRPRPMDSGVAYPAWPLDPGSHPLTSWPCWAVAIHDGGFCDNPRTTHNPGLARSATPRGPSLSQRRKILRKALVLRPWISDQAIAGYCGVSRNLVHATRRRMTAAGEIRAWPDRVGLDGKRYTRFSTPNPERTA